MIFCKQLCQVSSLEENNKKLITNMKKVYSKVKHNGFLETEEAKEHRGWLTAAWYLQDMGVLKEAKAAGMTCFVLQEKA